MPAEYVELTLALPDGYSAYGRYWTGQAHRGAVLYHHGIQSHCGWYEASAAALAEAGFSVLQMDRRGCGRNPANRGHSESAEQLIADAHAARDELLRRSEASQYHMIGVSWGGKLAVAAYVSDPAGVQSISLAAPGLFPRVGVDRDEMARIGFAMIYEPRKLFDIPLDDPDMFTSSAPWQRFIETDPLTLRQCTAGFYLASRRMDRIVARLPQSKPLPIHFLLAGDERIIDNEKTIAFAKGLSWPGVKITRYDMARHSIEYEGDAAVYFRDLIGLVESIPPGR